MFLDNLVHPSTKEIIERLRVSMRELEQREEEERR